MNTSSELQEAKVRLDIIMEHWGLATSLACEYDNIPKMAFEDILQHARIALMKASMKFDAQRGVSFSTFAWTVIKNELNSLYVRQRRFAAREAGMISWESINENGERENFDEFVDEREDVLAKVKLNEEKKAVYRAIEELPSRQQKVLQGVLAGRDYRLIGKELGFSEISSKTLVSRAYQDALKRLKEMLGVQSLQIVRGEYAFSASC